VPSKIAPLTPTRTRVTWVRWDKARMRNVTSHPYVWIVAEPDGYERSFDTRAEADAWVANYRIELDYAASLEENRA
jgi:hypothetical protein